MNVILFDNNRECFLPLAYTKPMAKFRVGILTIEEKWQHFFSQKGIENTISFLTEDYLSEKFPVIIENNNTYINSRFIPNKTIVDLTVELKNNIAIYCNDELVLVKGSQEQFEAKEFDRLDIEEIGFVLNKLSDLFSKNEACLNADFDLLTNGRKSEALSKTNTIIGDRIFLEEGAKVEASILNAETGPIYIGKNAEVMEGSIVRGGLALCEGGVLKMGAKIYGATTIGRYSKVGGEVNNSVIQDYSNKGHDGFLGNSVIGEWCNLGADTNTSNLKNNYSNVKVWSYASEELKNTEMQFCGLLMGDHSKSGINTMFNTATTVGVSANIFGSGFPAKFIPSFSWGESDGFVDADMAKMCEIARIVMLRRNVEFTTKDEQIFSAIFEQTVKYRQ